MGNQLSRRDALKRVGNGSFLVGAMAVAGFRSSAWSQSPEAPPYVRQPQFTREDLVHLFEGPWRGLRAVIEKKVIDIHCHLTKTEAPDGTLTASAEELVASMNIHGIAKACVGISDMTKLGESNPFRARPDVEVSGWGDEQVRAMGEFPGRFVVLFNPDFQNPNKAAEELRRRIRTNNVKGIGEAGAAVPGHEPTVEQARPVMEVAEEFDFPVHWGVRSGGYAQRDPGAVAKFAVAFPNVKHIIGDGGGKAFAYGGGWEAVILAASYPNIYLEIGGAPVEIVDGAVRNVGAERVLFGSDFSRPHPNESLPPGSRDAYMHWRNLNAVALSNTTEAQRDLILYQNAARLFKLDLRS